MKFELGKVHSNPYARAFKPQQVVEADGDHEVKMAQGQLDYIIKAANELKGKLGNGEKNIPGWIQDHISKAHSYIHQSNSGYHEYGTGVNEGKLQFKNLKKGDILVGKFPPYKEMEVVSLTDKSAKVKSSRGGVVDIYSTNNYELKENSIILSKLLKNIKENTEPEIITQLRDVMKSGYKTLKDPKSGKKMKVDSYSASAIVKVYDVINQTNKDKFSKLGLLGMQSTAFKLIK
jgi:translation elongation factor P/translation initiation factor 5A